MQPEVNRPINLDNPKISVVMSVYNGSRYLKTAIESILNQTYQDFEFIIVNDASTDNIEGILKQFADPRIKVIENPENFGLTKSLNKAIQFAKGKYIARMDADDISLPHRFETQINFLEKNPDYALLGSSYYQIDENSNIINFINVLTDDAHIREGLKKQNWFGHGSVLLRKDAYFQVGGYDERFKFTQDYDLWLKIAEMYKVANIQEPLYCWRMTKTCISKEKEAEQRYYANMAISEAIKREEIKKPEKLPLVSIVVPTYNRPEMLAETLQSILNQTYQNFEIVVVNDAGIDVSDVIEKYNQSGEIVYLQHEKNKGLAASRNTGARAAKGKYINYLDDDDIFYPDHLQTLVEFLESGEYKVAYADAQRAIQEKENDKFVTKYKDVPYSFDFDYDRILLTNFIPVLCIMHEKSCLNEVGYFDETLKAHEDWDLWMRMSRKFKFAHIRKVTCEFRWREDVSNMTFRNKDDMDITRQIVFQRGMKYSMMDYETKIEDKSTDKADLPRPKKRKDNAQSLLFIVHSSPLNNMGETENYTYHLARELHNRGNEVQILYPEYDATRPFGIVTEYTHEGLSVASMNVHPPQNFVEQFMNEKTGNAFRNYVSKLDVDLVHFHHFIGFSASPLQVCAQMGIPAVVTLHDEWMLCEQYFYLHVDGSYCSEGPETVEKCVQCFLSRHSEMDLMQYIQELYQVFTLRRQYLQNALKWIDTLIVPSKFLQEELKKHGFYHPKTLLIPLGLYTFNPLPWQPREGLLRFSYVGNINFTKGLDLVIDAFNILNTDNVQLNIYGNIQDLAYFKQVMNTSFKRQVIKHHGPYKPEDLPGIFSQTDVAIIPSRSESYPFLVRECLHAGVPVIASNVGGIPEIIQDGVNGFLFKQGDFRDLANKLQFIIQNPQKIFALRKNIQTVRTVSEDAEELKGIYREVLARKSKSK